MFHLRSWPAPLWALLSQLDQFRLRLLQIEAHVHLAVHRRRRRDMLAGLIALASAPVKPAEAKVAVRDEGSHAELRSPGQGGMVVTARGIDVRGVGLYEDRREGEQTPRLVALFAAPT